MAIWLNPFAKIVEKTVNSLICSDATTLSLAKQMANKRINFVCTQPRLQLQMDINKYGQLRLFSDTVIDDADLTLSGDAKQWSQQAMAKDSSDFILRIQGDIQLAAQLHKLMQNFDIDWGALFEPYMGGSLAQMMHMGLKNLHRNVNRTVNNLHNSTTDYLHYESDVTVSPNEAAHFYRQVDSLRSQVDRLTARVQQIKRQQA